MFFLIFCKENALRWGRSGDVGWWGKNVPEKIINPNKQRNQSANQFFQNYNTMGAASSKNVAKMISKANINISTDVSQSSAANASAVNVISQVCNNVSVKNRQKPEFDKPNVCFNAARQSKNVCSIEYTESGEDRIQTPDDDTANYSGGEKYEKGRELRAFCGANESNCNNCSNGEGKMGVWSKDDYESCTTTMGCAWAPTARRHKGKPTHCVSRCTAFEDASSCRNDGCEWMGSMCRDKRKIPVQSKTVGCEISNINQAASIDVVSKSMQDAALGNQTSQNLSQGLKQVAEASVTGVNFGALSKAENIGSQVAAASTSIKNRVNMTCGSGAFAKNVVEQACNNVSVESGGSAAGCKLSDVSQKATVKMQQDCHQKAVVQNKAVQDIQQVMDQLAVAKTTGLDLTAFLIAIVVCVSVVFFVVFKGAATFGGQMVMAAGAFMALFGSVMWIWAMVSNGWETRSHHYGMWDYHSGPRGDGTQTHATAGLRFADGFGRGGHKGDDDVNTPPVCGEKTSEQRDAEDKCMAAKDRRSCESVTIGDTGEKACRFDKNFCKPKWTKTNSYGWCYENGKGTVTEAYSACSEAEQCNAFFWKTSHKYKVFDEVPANVDRFEPSDTARIAERAVCGSVTCCDRKKCFEEGRGDINHEACKNCCPLSIGGHPYYLNLEKLRGKTGGWYMDYDWNKACRRCGKNDNKPVGEYYLYERHPTQPAFLPVESANQKDNIKPFLSCTPGIETWGAVEADRPLDLRGILGFTFLVGGVVSAVAGLIYHLKKKDPKSMLEIGQEALANAVKPKA